MWVEFFGFWVFFKTKRARINWHGWHLILSSGVTPPGEGNKASPLFPAPGCSAQVFLSPLVAESTSTFQYCHRCCDKPLLILCLSLSPLTVPTCDPCPLSNQDSPSLAAGCPLCLAQVASGGIWPPKWAGIKLKYPSQLGSEQRFVL